ncbi:MAG: hypothetical protein ACI4YB_03290 [Oscillospiraceae bacterium]
MNILKKTGSFFKAMTPVIVYFAVQVLIGSIGFSITLAAEMISSSAFHDTITEKSKQIINIAVNLICLFAAFTEMKIHKFSFKDISPVKQNGRVYIFTVLFSIGAFFVFKFAESFFVQITGMEDPMSSKEFTGGLAVLTFIAFLTGAFSEGLVFGGLTVKTFEKHFPVWVGAAAAIVTLTLGHDEFSICYMLLFSASLMFIRYKFGDLKLCILVYVIMTFLPVAMTFVNKEHYNIVINIGSAFGIVIAAAAMYFMVKFAAKAEQTSDER